MPLDKRPTPAEAWRFMTEEEGQHKHRHERQQESMTFKPDADLADQHAHWLASFDPRHRRKWESLLGNDPEAAMCEAHVRLLLAENGNDVVPNEDLAGGDKSPDFLCQQDGLSFYVEVTCLSIDKVTEATGLPDVRDCGAMICYAPLSSAIFSTLVDRRRRSAPISTTRA